jgi:hypothetical protein
MSNNNGRVILNNKRNDKAVDVSKLPSVEVVKNSALGMLVGSDGPLTYFGVTDTTGQTKWRASYNPKRVFDKHTELLGVDLSTEDREAAQKKFNAYFQSVTAPVPVLKFKPVTKVDAPAAAPAEVEATAPTAESVNCSANPVA